MRCCVDVENRVVPSYCRSMSMTAMRRVTVAGFLAVGAVLAGSATAAAAPYTREFTGNGGSSFGFAWDYARQDARRKAVADGFTDPATQCVETFAFGSPFSAFVIWTCTREV